MNPQAVATRMLDCPIHMPAAPCLLPSRTPLQCFHCSMMWHGSCKDVRQDRPTCPAHRPSTALVPQLQFSGSLLVPATEKYTFYLSSDEGSRLWLDGELVINHDGLASAHPHHELQHRPALICCCCCSLHSKWAALLRLYWNPRSSVWGAGGALVASCPPPCLLLWGVAFKSCRQFGWTREVPASRSTQGSTPSGSFAGLGCTWHLAVSPCTRANSALYDEFPLHAAVQLWHRSRISSDPPCYAANVC